MKKETIVLTLLAGAAVALLTSCEKKETPAAFAPDTIAVVEGNVISKAAFEAALRQRARAASRPENLATHKETVLKELVEFEALYAKACAAGWQTNAELVSGFKRAVVSRFKEEALAKPAVATQSEAEIQNHYAQQAAQFTRPGQTRAAILLLDTPSKVSDEKRQELRQRARQIHHEAVAGAEAHSHFGPLAQRHSIDQATRYTGGDFGLLTPNEIQARYGVEVREALAALAAAGDISEPVATPRGFAMVKLIERRPETRQPLAEVRDGIIYQLTQARAAQAERELAATAVKSATVRINQSALEEISLPKTSNEPPDMAAATATQP